MLILSLSNAMHDNAAVVADDYRLLAAVQRERVTRIKGDGGYSSEQGGMHAGMVAEALAIAGVRAEEIGQVVTTRGVFPAKYFHLSPWHNIRNSLRASFGKQKKHWLAHRMAKSKTLNMEKVLRREVFMHDQGLPPTLPLRDINHHQAHALSALFHTNWENVLVYTADGGGDNIFYAAYHYNGDNIQTLYGGDKELLSPSFSSAHSMGLVYAYMTEALGYKKNRHEGKLTGLAAFGQPVIADELKKNFSVGDDGMVRTTFQSRRQMQKRIMELGRSVNAKDAAASVQKLLETVVLSSIRRYLQKTGATRIALAGGVFANVALNRLVAELPGVEEVFIFPGMGDEGLAVGGLYDFLLQRDGVRHWSGQRRCLDNVYWGGNYDDDAKRLFAAQAVKIADQKNAPAMAAKLLTGGGIVAIYHGRMEFGPRALGGRSILASPALAEVNDTLNKRLQRTEFMPFAPYVLEDDADSVFDITEANRYAACFMTITCAVKQEWRDKIPAVVHVDGSARPQIINKRQNPLYAEVLNQFKAATGLPVLINTSFNAHEEPIVYKPEECLRALNDNRVDYVLLADGVYQKR